MRVRAGDFRPVSALPAGAPGARELAGGLLGGLLGAGFLALFVLADVTGALDSLRDLDERPRRQEPVVVEASFVQLGREFDPRELPDRQVDRSSFVKSEPKEVASARARPKSAPEEDAGVEPVDAYENLLDQLGNRADFYDRISRAEMEGSPDGVAEGNQKEGDAYRGKLYALFRRGLRAPPTVPDDVLRGLRAQVEFRITEGLRIRGLKLARSSGNPDFDRAVRTRIEEIEESDPVLPEPPAASRSTFVGPPIQMVITPPKSVARSAPSTPPAESPAEEGADETPAEDSPAGEAPAEDSPAPPAPSPVEREPDDLPPPDPPAEGGGDVD